MTNAGLGGAASPATPPVQVTVRDDGTRLVVKITGLLMISEAWRVREFGVEPADTSVVIDLGEVTEIDAAGVAAVVELARRLIGVGMSVSIEPPTGIQPARTAAMTGTFQLINQLPMLLAA